MDSSDENLLMAMPQLLALTITPTLMAVFILTKYHGIKEELYLIPLLTLTVLICLFSFVVTGIISLRIASLWITRAEPFIFWRDVYLFSLDTTIVVVFLFCFIRIVQILRG